MRFNLAGGIVAAFVLAALIIESQTNLERKNRLSILRKRGLLT
jgi:hypothetical protein